MDTQSIATETKKGVKLVFRMGDKKDFISRYENKIAIIDRALKTAPVAGISYTCDIKPMMKGNGWIVTAFEKPPAIKANLVFRIGKEKYNEKTNTYKQDYISTHESDGIIVIAPKEIISAPNKEFLCDIVLSPTGKAYIVEKAEPAIPAKARIIPHEYPVSCVEIEIGGVLQDDLRFDCTDEDEKDLENKLYRLSCRSIIDKEMTISNYEATCLELIGKHKNMCYGRNKRNLQ